MTATVTERLAREVVEAGICTGCGACVALEAAGRAAMTDTPFGPIPVFPAGADLPELAWTVCPGKGIPHAALYRRHYGQIPENWLLGCFKAVRTGHSANEEIRRAGASGGVMTHVLIHLLETRRIDAAVVVRQGVPEPEKARAVLAATRDEILAGAQSVYVPVSVLDILPRLEPGKRYAMTCLPDQAAALRQLQLAGHPQALQVKYVLGPYTGTAIYPAAIQCYLRSKGVKPGADRVESLKWRAGEWPGYMEIRLASGKVFRSKKFYYNFLIPFFVTQNSLQSVDFANEFADLSVGDAWSPRFESLGGGHSVIVTRSDEMEAVVREMEGLGLLATEPEDPLRALAMHGHMMDFKKRGGFIRNRLRVFFGRKAPVYDIRPETMAWSRVAVEIVVSSLFLMGSTRLARWMVARLPERVIGPVFNRLRLTWKAMSKPTKRKALGTMRMRCRVNGSWSAGEQGMLR
jgi:coenzyme F420 hydrogenase subunit beta